MSELPPGFVLDTQPQATSLPQGFVLDQPGMMEDAAKSTAAGLGKMTVSTLGMAGDLTDLGAAGIQHASNYISDKLGIDRYQPSQKSVLDNIPTSRSIRATVADPIVDPDYKPQYTLGKILNRTAEFAPNVAFGGGVRGALQNVVAPAIGSLAGEEVAGPLGGLAGAVIGGVGATSAARKFQEMAAARQAARATPSAEDLLKSGSSGFESVKASDAVIKPSSIEQMAKDIKTELLNEGKHPTSEGQAGVFAALDRLESLGASGGGVTPKDIEIIRKNLVDLKPNLLAGPTARMASDKFMEKYANLGQGDLLNGSNPFPTLKDAIGDWAAGKRSNTLQGKVDLAKLNADTAGSGANGDNAMRQAIKQLARPMNNTNVPVAKRLGYNDAEIAGIKGAATGSLTGNVARYIGKAAPTGIVSGAMSSGAGHIAGGPIGAVALPAVGFIAKKIGDLSTKRAVAAVDSLVRSRSPLAAHVAAQLPPQLIQQLPAKSQRLLQALVLADPTLAQQSSQPVGQPQTY